LLLKDCVQENMSLPQLHRTFENDVG